MTPTRFAATAAACAALLAPFGAFAQPKAQGLTAQQQRMQSCNAEARDKQIKGEERKAFMSRCLKGEGGERKMTAQQEKMVTCNRTARERNLKGEERKRFMSDCLSTRSGATGRTSGGAGK